MTTLFQPYCKVTPYQITDLTLVNLHTKRQVYDTPQFQRMNERPLIHTTFSDAKLSWGSHLMPCVKQLTFLSIRPLWYDWDKCFLIFMLVGRIYQEGTLSWSYSLLDSHCTLWRSSSSRCLGAVYCKFAASPLKLHCVISIMWSPTWLQVASCGAAWRMRSSVYSTRELKW